MTTTIIKNLKERITWALNKPDNIEKIPGKLMKEIKNISGHFDIKLDIDEKWLIFITDHLKKVKPVDTIDRCSNVYNAIINKEFMK